MSDTAGELNFDITLTEVPVIIGGDKYILREADGDATCKWQNKMFRATKLNEQGKPVGLDNVADVEPFFLSLCLYPVVKGEVAAKPVPETTIRKWPHGVIDKLYKRLLDISNLNKKDTKESLEEKMNKAQEELDDLKAKYAVAGEDGPKD